MKKSLRNRVYMLNRISAVLENYQEDYSSNPELVNKVSEFNTHLQTLRDLSTRHAKLKLSWSTFKKTELNSFLEKYSIVHDYVRGYARTAGENEISTVLNRSITELTTGSAGKVSTNISACISAIQSLEDIFTGKPKLEALWQEVLSGVSLFEAHLMEPSTRKRESRLVGEQIESLEKVIMAYLKNQLDPEIKVETLKVGAFYKTYILNRIIPKIGATSTKTDEELNTPVPVEIENDPPSGDISSNYSDTSEDDATI